MEKDWKQVFLSGEMYQAEIAKEVLENNNIECVILNQKDSSFTSFGNYEVYVHESNADKAIELIKELKS